MTFEGYTVTEGYKRSKYGNETNMDLEEAVEFVHYFDLPRTKYSESQITEIVNKLEVGQKYNFGDDFIATFIRRES